VSAAGAAIGDAVNFATGIAKRSCVAATSTAASGVSTAASGVTSAAVTAAAGAERALNVVADKAAAVRIQAVMRGRKARTSILPSFPRFRKKPHPAATSSTPTSTAPAATTAPASCTAAVAAASSSSSGGSPPPLTVGGAPPNNSRPPSSGGGAPTSARRGLPSNRLNFFRDLERSVSFGRRNPGSARAKGGAATGSPDAAAQML
jgi:hypothetical protein